MLFFYRYVIVECEDQDTQLRDPKTHEMYLNVMRRFSQALLKVSTLNKIYVPDVHRTWQSKPQSALVPPYYFYSHAFIFFFVGVLIVHLLQVALNFLFWIISYIFTISILVGMVILKMNVNGVKKFVSPIPVLTWTSSFSSQNISILQ